MGALAAFMGFPMQKVASLMRLLSGFQIVAIVSRQFRKANKLHRGDIPSFQILSTVSTKLIRPVFCAQDTVARVSLTFLIGMNDA